MEELLRELEKIRQEKVAEKAKQESEETEKTRVAREEEIATADPLPNLAAALGHESTATRTGTAGTFAVKRRWDDDRILQNQALDRKGPSGQFMGDPLRTESQRKFMSRFVK